MFILFFLSFLLLSNKCLSAAEPLCSKFSYDEQLLERMIRTEFNVNNMEKNMLATEKSMLETRESVLKTQENMENTLNEIKDKIKQLQEREETLIDKINAEVAGRQGGRVVAFHAREVADKSLSNNQVIVFTKVAMNEGDGYDDTNGYFTAPVSGVYHFTSHLCGANGKSLEYILVVNDETWASGLFTPNGSGRCTSVSVTVSVQSGERVWATIDKSGSSSADVLYEDSDDWNYFSGFLIHEMD